MTEIDEAELLAAARAGRGLSGAGDGQRRSVPAALLRRCCRELAAQVDPRGLHLRDLNVAGQLDLAGIAVPFPLRFDNCAFDSVFMVEGADLFELALTGCALPGLLGNGLRLRRDLDLSRSVITGSHATSASIARRAAVWLSESAVGGRLICVDTRIDGLADRALHADRIRIGGSARFIHQFTATGEIRLIGARIDGAIEFTGAHVTAEQGLSLDIEGASIAGSMMIIEDPSGRKPEFRGRMDLGGASIAGGILARNAVIDAGRPGSPYTSYFKAFTTGDAIRARGLSLGGEFTLEQSQITGGIDLAMSDLGSLWITAGSTISAPGATALELANAEIRGSIVLGNQTAVRGTIRLEGAAVHGTLALHAKLRDPENRSLVGATGVTVDGDLYLEDLDAEGGRLNFRGASLGMVTAAGAKLSNPAGDTINLHHASIGGPVRLVDEFSSEGELVLSRCRVEGRLLLSGGSFTCPDQHGPEPRSAIDATSAVVSGGLDLGWAAVSPRVDFTDTAATFLADDPATWPEQFAISGLTYERFQAPQGLPSRPIWDAPARCAWLARQTAFDSGPYEQAARVFREHGYVSEAEQILIAQRRQARLVSRSTASWPRRVLDRGYAAIGYGYRPWRVLWLTAVLLVLVAVSLVLPAGRASMRASDGNGYVYSTAGLVATPAGPARPRLTASRTCGDGDIRCLNPALYAVDTVVPLISLDQRSTWYPDPRVRYGEAMVWWLDLATILGWLLSSVFVLSLARLSRPG
jgi:hypothetical protein